MSWPDWGNAPAWLSAGSFIVAASVYLRDRRRIQMRHVDNMVLRSEVQLGWRPMNEGDPDAVKIQSLTSFTLTASVKNIGDHPFYLGAIGYKVQFTWGFPNDPDRSHQRRELLGVKYYDEAAVDIGETVNYSRDVEFSKDDTGTQFIEWVGGSPRMTLSDVYVTDYAGQRWRLSPLRGRRPRKIHRYHLRWPFWSKSSWPHRHPWHPMRPSEAQAMR